jgi:hypothetical protein
MSRGFSLGTFDCNRERTANDALNLWPRRPDYVFLTGRVAPLPLTETTGKSQARARQDPMYTIATAAAAVGRNKTAILRAINAGKIPVAKDEGGEWFIDPAELHRIYPPLRSASMRDKETQLRLHQSPLLTQV